MTSIENIIMPPNDFDLECLGLSMISMDQGFIPLLDEDCFFHDSNKKIFNAIKKTKTWDWRVLSIETGIPEESISEIVQTMVSVSSSEYIVNELHKYKNARTLIKGIRLLESQARSLDIESSRKTITEIEKLIQVSLGEQSLEDIAVSYFEDIDKEKKEISTGYLDIDKCVSFCGGDLIIVAGRPSMGKTTFMLNMALRESSESNVGFISMEMKVFQIIDRFICIIGDLNSYQIKDKKGNIEKISEYLGKIIDKKLFLTENIYNLSKIEQFIVKNKIDICYIDYLGLIQYGDNKMNVTTKIGEITRQIKLIAKKYNCCIVLGCQLSRAVEGRIDKRPVLADLRDSGNIEQDADVVMMLHREEYYDKETEMKDVMDVLIRKNRNGETKEIFLPTKFSSYRVLNNKIKNEK